MWDFPTHHAPYFVPMTRSDPIFLLPIAILLAGCGGPSDGSAEGALHSSASEPASEDQPTSSGVPPCWTAPADELADAQWTHFAAVDRLDASFRAAAHVQLMHLCWAEDGQCPSDQSLFGFYRDALDHFTGVVVPKVPWDESGTASIRMGPVQSTMQGITIDAAAFIWADPEEVVSRRYVLDAVRKEWVVLDSPGIAEEASYALSHAGMPFLDMEWAWPQSDHGETAFSNWIIPALSNGLFAGNVSREIRCTPLDSAHWGWESYTDHYGCGAPHGFVNHEGRLFDPRSPDGAAKGFPASWGLQLDTPWGQTATQRMRSLLSAFFTDNEDNGCGHIDDINWAKTGTIGGGLSLCARPGLAGTVIPTLFNAGDPPHENRYNGYCTPRVHLDLSEAAFREMLP